MALVCGPEGPCTLRYKRATVQQSASMPYLLQDDQNQICLLLLSKAEAQALYPSEFVCIRQEGFNGEYIEYDDLG